MIRKRFFKTKDECEVTFELEAPGVELAELTLSSNDWRPVAMRRSKAGRFKLALRLPVDRRTEFCYRLDGKRWQHDPASDGHVANPFGTTNSVVDTTRPAI
jgi:1,4-alpha-glucan branching enzyme